MEQIQNRKELESYQVAKVYFEYNNYYFLILLDMSSFNYINKRTYYKILGEMVVFSNELKYEKGTLGAQFSIHSNPT